MSLTMLSSSSSFAGAGVVSMAVVDCIRAMHVKVSNAAKQP